MAETRNQEIVRHTEILCPAAAKAKQFVSLKLKRFAAIFWSDVILTMHFQLENCDQTDFPGLIRQALSFWYLKTASSKSLADPPVRMTSIIG